MGSTRPAKVEGVRDALEAIGGIAPAFAGAEICPVDLGGTLTGAPAMPLSERETIEGARLRAAALLSRLDRHAGDRAFVVGVEGGLDAVSLSRPALSLSKGVPQYVVKTWACVSDGARWSYGTGGGVPLPGALVEAVLAGRELGDVVDGLAGTDVRGTRGAWGLATRDLFTRRDAFRIAVISAFAPFYNEAFYGFPRSRPWT